MTRPDITMIRVERTTVYKLKMIGRKNESYSDIIERIIKKSGVDYEA